MEMYLSGRNALEYWGFSEVCETLCLPEKTEYVFFSGRDHHRSSELYKCQIRGAKRYTEDGVCTLPYIFLRYAHELSLLKLIYLGLQICACPNERIQLCTVRKLRDCANSLVGHRGRRKALQAIQYIQNNSCSPMESRLYMLLCLPNFLGGCAFPKAILNKAVQVDSRHYFIDLYFPESRVGVEYDSYEYHNNAKSYSRDNLRDAKLRTAGYKLIHVKPGQLDNPEAFQDLVINISHLLNKPVYIRTPKFFEPFKELFYFFKPEAYEPVKFSEIPQFGGVAKAFEEYR